MRKTHAALCYPRIGLEAFLLHVLSGSDQRGRQTVLLEHGDERDRLVRCPMHTPRVPSRLSRSPHSSIPVGHRHAHRQLPQPAAPAPPAEPASAASASADEPSAAQSISYPELEKLLAETPPVYLIKARATPHATRAYPRGDPLTMYPRVRRWLSRTGTSASATPSRTTSRRRSRRRRGAGTGSARQRARSCSGLKHTHTHAHIPASVHPPVHPAVYRGRDAHMCECVLTE